MEKLELLKGKTCYYTDISLEEALDLFDGDTGYSYRDYEDEDEVLHPIENRHILHSFIRCNDGGFYGEKSVCEKICAGQMPLENDRYHFIDKIF